MTTSVDFNTWLLGRGLSPQEADLWSDFIVDALDLLEDGHSLLRTPTEWASFLTGCHGSRPSEPEITSGLGDRMERLRIDSPLGSDREKLTIQYEAPTPGDHSHGIRKSKADFRFVRKFEAGYAAAFVVEAKPLSTQADLSSRYLGADGLGCFIHRAPPYSSDLIAGMVGYVRVEPTTWQSRLRTALSSRSETRLDQVEMRGGLVLVSDHARTQGLPPVTIVHTMLDFT